MSQGFAGAGIEQEAEILGRTIHSHGVQALFSLRIEAEYRHAICKRFVHGRAKADTFGSQHDASARLFGGLFL
jgi:hypothetical protein